MCFSQWQRSELTSSMLPHALVILSNVTSKWISFRRVKKDPTLHCRCGWTCAGLYLNSQKHGGKGSILKRCEKKGPSGAHFMSVQFFFHSYRSKMKGEKISLIFLKREIENSLTFRPKLRFLVVFFLARGAILWSQTHFLFLFIRENRINK